MKNIKTLTVAAILMGIISVTSCKKDVELQKETSTAPNSFKEIKADPTFNWKSTKVISLNVIAADPAIEISNTLFVKTENGEVLLSKLQKMNEAYIGKLTVPSKTEKVIISYGSIVKTISVTNGNVVMNYFN